MIQTGEEYQACYLKYQRLLTKAATTYYPKRQDYCVVEDIVAGVFLRLLEQSPIFPNEAACVSYMLRIVHSLAVSGYCTSSELLPYDIDSLDNIPKLYRTVDSSYAILELLLLLVDALKDLPEDIRDAYIRHVVFGESIKNLAKELDIEYDALRKQFYRIRKKLLETIPKSDILYYIVFLPYVPFFTEMLFYIRGQKI